MATVKKAKESVKSEYLSEIEMQEIVKFNKNVTMSNAVKKVILNVIYNQGKLEKDQPVDMLRNFALSKVSQKDSSNEELGQDLRAIWEACNMLEDGFRNLGKIEIPKKEDDKPNENPAR